MFYSVIADSLVIIHLLFILFVIFGGLLVFKWQWVWPFHVLAVIWGVLIEFFSWGCPLTPFENHFRQMAGEEAYSGGFIDHYIMPIIYPADLTQSLQFFLGILAIAINVIVYYFVLRKIKKSKDTAA